MFKIRSLVFCGGFLLIIIFANTTHASNGTRSWGNFQCDSSSTKDCEQNFSLTDTTFQAWKADWEFQYKGLGSNGGNARQDVCINISGVAWQGTGYCWLTVSNDQGVRPSFPPYYYATSLNTVGGYTTVSGTLDVDSKGSFSFDDRDFQQFVIHIRSYKATTRSYITTGYGREVEVTSFTGPASIILGAPLPLTWRTDWGQEGAYIVQTNSPLCNQSGSTCPSYTDAALRATGATEPKNGTYTFPASQITKTGVLQFKLCAMGPGVAPTDSAGSRGTRDGPGPQPVYAPDLIKTAFADTTQCAPATITVNVISPVVAPVCSPSSLTKQQGQTGNFSDTKGGGSNDTWTVLTGTSYGSNKNNCSPTSGTGTNFNTSCSVDDSWPVKVTNSAGSSTCTFNTVTTGTVNVYSTIKNTTFGFGGTGAFSGCPSPMDTKTNGWTCNSANSGGHAVAAGSNTISNISCDSNIYACPAVVSPNATQNLSVGGTVNYNISYNYLPPTVDIKCNNKQSCSINYGDTANLSWSTSNATSCTAVMKDGSNNPDWKGGRPINGSQTTVPLTTTKIYKLNCDGLGGSNSDTVTVTIGAVPAPVCSPASQTVQVNNAANFSATSGDGTYSWSAPGGNPASAPSGSTFSTTYSSAGSDTVTVTSSGLTSTCAVIVNPSPTPTPTASLTLNILSFTATPSSGNAPLSSTLSATVGGTAVGTINYSFWWNCVDAGTNVAIVSGICGALPAPAGGSCLSNANGYKCNGMVPTSQSTSANAYNANSTAKVIVERDGAASVEARTAVTIVVGPTPTPTPTPSSTPSVSNVTVTQPDYCASGPAVRVDWTYSDPLGGPQSAYRIQIDNNASFVSPEVDTITTYPPSGKVSSVISSGATGSFFSGTGILAFGVNYNVRVMVWNNADAPSAWSSTATFSTPNYAYPQVGFSFSPTNPAISAPVQFTDSTTFYAPGPKTWSWNFGDAGSSALQNPSHTYTTQGSYGATLTAIDNAGHSCSLTQPVNIQAAIPIWKEVAPR